MNKTIWHSKLVRVGIALALVLSLAGALLLPVLADPGPELTVSVTTDADTYCCCDNITVTARITNNSGEETAENVTASISWIPSGELSWVSGGSGPAPHTITVGNMTAGNYTDVEWVLHCDGPGVAAIRVNVSADNAEAVSDQTYIEQQSAELQVAITSPSDDVCERSWLVCSSHNVTFSITNIGCRAARLVTATIYPAADIEVVVGGVGRGGGTPWTTPTLGTLDPDESINYTLEMHCVEAGLGSQIHIKTNGWDECTDEEISEEYLHSDIVEINQYEGIEITCDADSDYTKHCHNITFTVTATGGLPPYSWNWTFGDGTLQAGSGLGEDEPLEVSHHYTNNTTEAVVYEACVNVTDTCGYSDICCHNITVYPALTASCEADPLQTKVCHNVTFTGTGVGGLPLEICQSYYWQWSFDDGTSAFGTGYTAPPINHHYDAAGNYTAVFTVGDECMDNEATCNVTVEVFPPLSANCTADPLQTKVCHDVTFNGTGVDGFPEESCNYTWEWDFGDDTDPVAGDGKTSGNVTHHYAEAGNFTAIFTIQDDCMDNEATCNVTVEVFPPLSANCTATPNPTKVGDDVTFTGTGVDGLPINVCDSYNWTWDFGDLTSPQSGNGYTSGAVTHGYTTAGNYTAVFTIWDNCMDNEASCNVTVEVFPPLDVTCDAERAHVCHEAQFTAERVGGVDGHNYTWQWDFGDGGTSTGQNSTHTYMCVGIWTATVTLTDAELGNNATCNTTVEVYIEAPDLYFPLNMAQLTSKNVTFEWEDIGCCNYTLEVWQKEEGGQQVWEVDTGHNNQWTMCIFDGDWRWRVTATACNGTATSDTWFFQMDAPEPSVTIHGPNGGETLVCNSIEVITWDADPFDATIEILYSTDGISWTQVASGEANDGRYDWTVPCIDSERCSIALIARDACQGRGDDTSDGVFTITSAPEAVTSYNITLHEDWNLISLPLIPESSNITDVLAGVTGANVTQVWAYDPTLLPGNPWLSHIPGVGGNLTTMEDGIGYWVVANGEATLTVTGQCMPDPPATPPMYAVYDGWNLIGYKSIITRTHDDYLLNVAGRYTVIWGYDEGWALVFPLPLGTGMLTPGQGYWIWMTEDGTIVPSGF